MSSKFPSALFITPGAKVINDGREFTVLKIADLNRILAKEDGSGEKVIIDISTLSAPRPTAVADGTDQEVDLLGISTEDWEVAELRRQHLEPMLQPGRHGQAASKAAAEALGVSPATVYRWVQNFRASGQLLSSLLPTRPEGGKGRSRLDDDAARILHDCIENFHLTDQRPSMAATVKEVRRLCSNAGVKPLPAGTTVRRHIEWIDESERIKRREGEKAARQRFAHRKGSIPDTEWPLSLVQMDHTLLPVMIVDDKHRLPINRAWITLAIDVNSRTCLGMCLSLDPPSAMSAGMCLSHAILPKEKWLQRLGLGDIDWPCYGVMDVLHMDNAREFRGNMLKVACLEYDIDIHLRPVKKPHYGAHIERLMGTVTEKLKIVKGATFSGVAEKGEYDAEGYACMTLDELEKWLVLMFAEYHSDIHTGIGTTPKQKWREGIMGTKNKSPRGLPARRQDEEKVRIDFMPFEERTVQEYGVVIDDIHYFHDVLRRWVNAPDIDHPQLKRKFRFRRDPRDISELYFFCPDRKKYFAIPYRDTSLPSTSIWEYRDSRRMAIERGLPAHNEREVFQFMTRRRELEEESAKKTKTARRAAQERRQHVKARKIKEAEMPAITNAAPTALPSAIKGYDPSRIKPIKK